MSMQTMKASLYKLIMRCILLHFERHV